MMPELKFSIVIPTFNRAPHIGLAIQSLLDQTYGNFEILVIDDGSTDNTKDVVKTFSDSRVRYIAQENRERGAARNNGIKNATGDIIGFLDSDDVVLADHLEKTATLIHSHDKDSVFVMSYRIEEDGKTKNVILPGEVNHELINGNLFSCNGVFLRKAVTEKFMFSEDRDLSALEDWELWLRIAASYKIVTSPEITSIIIQHDQRSVMLTSVEKIEKRFAAFYRHVFADEGIKKYYKGRLGSLRASCETYMALHIALTKKFRSATIKHLFSGICHSPAIIFKRRFYAILKRLL